MHNMRIFAVLLVFVVSVTSLHDKIIIITQKQQRVYNFFPLECSGMVFLVKSTSDVHIIFTQEPAYRAPYYEIVFGGWDNTKSVIRKDNDDPRVEHKGAAVNQNEFSHYWAHLNTTGKSVSAGNSLTSRLMQYIDKSFVSMSYFGISTGFGSEGEWHFSTNDFCCKAVFNSKQQRIYNFFPLECSGVVFLVKATNDVHIIFTQEPAFQAPYYEIVFGAWDNTKSLIRKDNQDARTEHLGSDVNQNEFGPYWANLNSTEKSVSAGNSLTSRLMHIIDKNFVKMNYFGISTGFGSEGEWHFSTNDFCCNVIYNSP